MGNFWLFGIITVGICLSLVEGQPTLNATTKDDIFEENESADTCGVSLDFSNMGLNIIHSNFISSPYIKRLTLQNNSITQFDDETFSSVPNLEYLDLSNNRMSADKLFSFGEIPSLKFLTLDNNFAENLERYSRSSRCRHDEMWDSYYDGCRSVPYSKLDIKNNYPELQYLSLRNINVNSVTSDWEYRFPRLKHLDISDNNNFGNSVENLFKNLPSTVTKLILENVGLSEMRNTKKPVTFLNLNRNHFETLSSNYCYQKTLCLKEMSYLKSLLLSNCSIKRIETDAFKEVGNLLHLDISNNEFQEIPDGTFDHVPLLTSLNISGNSLSAVPDISALQKLTTLIMDKMKGKFSFESVTESTQLLNLEVLSLRNNQLTTIPASFLDNLPNLKKLDLTNNAIISLSPWEGQKNLVELHLNGNKVSSVEDLSLHKAASLKLLSLQKNLILSIKLISIKQLPDDVVLKL